MATSKATTDNVTMETDNKRQGTEPVEGETMFIKTEVEETPEDKEPVSREEEIVARLPALEYMNSQVRKMSEIDFRPLMMNNKWTTNATGLLLDLYIANEDKFNSPSIKKKLLWKQISEKLNSLGHCFDPDRCERKFLNLKTTYRYTFDHNMQTGNQKRCAFYDQLDRIFRHQMVREYNDTYESIHTNNDTTDSGDGMGDNPALDTESYRPRFMNMRGYPMVPNMKFTQNVFPGMSLEDTSMQPSHRLLQQQRQTKSPQNQPSPLAASQTPPPNMPPRNAAVVDLAEDDENDQIPSSSGLSRTDDGEIIRKRKRRQTDLDCLLSTFEKYRHEQREREEKRMAAMKELHEEEMKVINRFLDIIQQSIQNGS